MSATTRELPSSQRTVIIGAGIVGNSLAYHLCRLGETEVTLLDKGPLPNPGGSTGHASNFIFPVDHNKEMTLLTLESMRQYKELGVFIESGGIEVARTQERMQELHAPDLVRDLLGDRARLADHPRRGQGARSLHQRAADPRRLLHPGRRRRRLAAGGDDHA